MKRFSERRKNRPTDWSAEALIFDQLMGRLQADFPDNMDRGSDGWWTVNVKTRSRRSQVVHAYFSIPDEQQHRQTPRIVVISLVAPFNGKQHMMRLENYMRENARLNHGMLCIEDMLDEDDDVVTYLTIRWSRSLSIVAYDDLLSAIEEIAHTADRLEHQFSAHDLH